MPKILTDSIIPALKGKLSSYSTGKATKAGEYVVTGDCYWWRYGRLIIGYFDELQVSQSASQLIVFTGLPHPTDNMIITATAITNPSSSTSGIVARMSVSSSGNLQFHYTNINPEIKYIGNFTYIAAEE